MRGSVWNFRRSLRRALLACDGNFSIAIAFAMLPIAACVGLAVDYTSAVRAKSRLQAAVDGAVLAAATAEAHTAGSGSSVFASYLQDAAVATKIPATVTSEFQVDATGFVTGAANVTMPNSFMRLFNVDTTPVNTTAKASYGAGKAEIALVLDNTYSMNGSPIAALQDASKNLIATIYGTPNALQRVKFSIVPFSRYVNVGLGYSGASWIDVPPAYNSTYSACSYPAGSCTSSPSTCTYDGVSYSCSVSSCSGTPTCSDVTYTNTWDGCVGSRPYPLDVTAGSDFSTRVPGLLGISCNAPLTRLTNDTSVLNSQIDAMTVTDETFIASGLIWGWRTLAPTLPFQDGATNNDVRKYIVLMTDGANTVAPSYPEHDSSDASLSNNLTNELCTNLKAQGVTIYVVALGISDATATNLLNSCASGPPYYYSASTTSQLANAFESIGKSLTAVQLTQ